jgi:hypothetical protein
MVSSLSTQWVATYDSLDLLCIPSDLPTTSSLESPSYVRQGAELEPLRPRVDVRDYQQINHYFGLLHGDLLDSLDIADPITEGMDDLNVLDV